MGGQRGVIGGLLSVISDGSNLSNLAVDLSTQIFSSKYGCGGVLLDWGWSHVHDGVVINRVPVTNR